MVTVGALEALRTGTTTIVENSGGIGRHAAALAQTGLRCVFAESIRDSENVAGPMSPDGLARSETPQLLAEAARRGPAAHQRPVHHVARREAGTHQRVPRRRARRNLVARVAAGGPRLRREARSRLHDPPVPEPRRGRFHGAAPWRSSAGVSRRGTASSARGCSRRTAATSTTPTSRCSAARAPSCRTRRRWPRTAASSRRSPALRAAGCPIANGTDNNTNDLFEVMRVALLTERISRDDAFPGVRPQPEDMLEDATQGGARAVRQDTLVGSLEVGKKADLLVVDTLRAHLVPAGRIVSALDPQRSAVRHRVGDGRRSVRHAQPQGADDGRGAHRRRSRQGRAADLDTGAGRRARDRAGPAAPPLSTDPRHSLPVRQRTVGPPVDIARDAADRSRRSASTP